MAGVTVTLELEAEEFQTLRAELMEADDRLRGELNELSRSVDERAFPRTEEDQAVYQDKARRLYEGRERLRKLQALIEDLG